MSINLADYDNPIVKNKSEELTKNANSVFDKINVIFHYVRDDIKFAFPKEGDFVKASQTIQYGFGQCNTKTTLFLALCKSIGIPARIHFSLIKKDIQKGLFSGIAFWLMPKELSHSWIEIKIDEKWISIDSYINDKYFYEAAKEKLKEKSWDTGYSIASKNKSSIKLDFNNEKFMQMDAVTTDHGVYNEPMDYYSTSKYKNRPNAIKLFIYGLLIKGINKKIKKLRYSYDSSWVN
ncbi:MAG: hypothetical protein GWO87_00895 [Xanthomonadaceae bacterium]|nr:hypothetical protein [Rhodospirillaceae bacterium]NIA17731.1 hypothetical protein [Xanthomonadaceae bacterium]